MNKLVVSSLLLTSLVLVVTAQSPFKGVQFYVNPTFQVNVDKAISTLDKNDANFQKISNNLKIARNAGSAYWLDVMSKVQTNDTSLDSMNGILLDASKKKPAAMTVFIVYDLPNRDCAALASAGEICCTTDAKGKCDFKAAGDCAQGIAKYKNSYIANIITIMNKFKDSVPMAFVIEPDSLGNLVSNSANPSCGPATEAAYKAGITFAISEISKNAPKIPIYLDLAHGGWLGYQTNAQQTQKLVTSLDILSKIRGFATNVSNYQPLGEPCPEASFCLPDKKNEANKCCADPCGLNPKSNPANSELNYVQEMSALFPGKFFIIDTGRNGVPAARTDCSNWCNARKTGLGRLPTADAPLPVVDALFWLKTPGETDGCTEELPTGGKCTRFDAMCASTDSLGTGPGEPRMPEAGGFSAFQLVMLARNADFGSGNVTKSK